MKGRKKKIYKVEIGETIDECLLRIEKDGYQPVRRLEKPIFKEVIEKEKTSYIPIGREIIFEAKQKGP